ncbi:hypothetical protein BDW22DRAFT_969056 [Trametopsis cervina]|nr:hypothetical protein BDW22DRAFT_969056 [Trametopsis cervina]
MTSLRAPSVSRRISIRFIPQPAGETTSTLVLNGGGITNVFADFRPLLADPSTCEWAFAGVKRYLEDGSCMWEHWVDNRSGEGDEEAMPDIGHCETLPNGDELEKGEMLNPETGKIEAYEEVWRDEMVPSGARVLVLQLQREATEISQVHGVFLQVGEWAQVIMRYNGAVSARRWKFGDRWEEVATHGDRSIPAPTPTNHDLSGIAGEVAYGPGSENACRWVVVEDYVWNPTLIRSF